MGRGFLLGIASAFALAACGGDTFKSASGGSDAGAQDATIVDASGSDGGACVPQTCATQGWQCGTGDDGCGGTLDCGLCAPPQTCGGGGDHKCGTGACIPRTCQQAGAQCGKISDGCAGTLDCGVCVKPNTCGGGGTPHQCGCTPGSCASFGYQCGIAGDGCGGKLDCGVCANGATCSANHCNGCVPQQTCLSAGYTCGAFVDSCNVTEMCGAQPVRNSSNDTLCKDPDYTKYFECTACGSVSSDAGGPPITACSGATPPEPGWKCLALPANAGGGISAWCCQ